MSPDGHDASEASARPESAPFELGDVGGTGPALLCLHGLTGTPYEVRPPKAVYAELGFACLGPALPGHLPGETPEELARTPRSAWLEAVTSAFDRLAATHGRVFVMGLSLGGVLALALAQHRAVAGLLVLGAPIDLGRLYRRLIPLLVRVLPSVPRTPGIVDEEARERHPGYRRMPLRSVVELIKLQAEVEVGLGRVIAPARLLYSRADRTVSPSDAARIARQLAGAVEIEYLETSGHVMSVDLERDRVHAWMTRSLVELLESADGPRI